MKSLRHKFNILVLSLEKQIFRGLRVLYRSTYRKKRPSSYPFLTGDSFRELADHIYDETTPSFNSDAVNSGDIVFVGSPFLRIFLQTYHQKINTKYILIEHNGDDQVTEDILPYLDDKIYRFYAQCALVTHEKITPIPIGVENLHHGNNFLWLLKKVPKKNKVPRIFYHFSNQTNPKERIPAALYFKTHPIMDTITSFIPYRPYKNLLNSYAFVASPAGNTLGSHRTWEALYLHTVPIVKRTPDAEACASYGLPLWILDDWLELEDYTEEKLQEKYLAMMRVAKFDALYMDYWITKINEDQRIIRGEQ